MIGDGAMGTLCANMLAENGMQVRLWSAFPDAAEEMRRLGENRRFLPGVPLAKGVEITSRDDQAFEHAQLAVSAVPTQYIRGVWQRLCAHVPPNLGICSVAKGIEVATLLRPTQVLAELQQFYPELWEKCAEAVHITRNKILQIYAEGMRNGEIRSDVHPAVIDLVVKNAIDGALDYRFLSKNDIGMVQALKSIESMVLYGIMLKNEDSGGVE